MASSEQEEGDASVKESEDEHEIVWENPDTPSNADDYIFMHGKRMVRPYFFEFIAHVKRRWAGKTVVEIFTHEFKGRAREYYVQAIENGRIRVEGAKVSPSFLLRDSQKMSHFVHRHEPPVMPEPVVILEEGPDVITVCKPASIPVHPCGQYRKNTVMGILEAEHKTGQLFPIHRLDRLVSGLLILARNARTANLFREEIEGGRVLKQYVAKVKGVFPAEEVEVNAAVIYDPREGISSVETGQSDVGKGKAACTRFQRLSTDGVCSIVRCEPVTGRTHQIRVHLQHLGHPVANDDLYLQAHPPKRSREGVGADTAAKAARILPASSVGSASTAAGEGMLGSALRSSETEKSASNSVKGDVCCSIGEKQKPGQEVVRRDSSKDVSFDIRRSNLTTDGGIKAGRFEDGSTEPLVPKGEARLDTCPVKLPQERVSDQMESKVQFSVDKMCTHCPNLGPTLGYKSFDEDGLWLHCVRYASPSWAYECPFPAWAL